ncbi:uncharacterized protein [Misgurnus anguillicaudatus]|uniref:uncharacterized protein isoform X4 n=1 Tax=Misgurnus anguillicaudatus TaxID=75329 RepID=UPI003CCF43FE
MTLCHPLRFQDQSINFFEGLNFVTKEQPELNLQCYTQTPTLAFTYESTPSQRPFEINQDTQNWTSDLFFQPDRQTGVNLLNRRGEEAECYDLEEMIPAVVITQPEEDLNQSENTMLSTVDMVSSNVSPSDSTEFTSSDLQSLKSDTVSLISGKSDDQEGPEEDTQSVTASSVMSLFHRMQMDPVEKEWLRCAALGKYSALYILLQQDNTLVSKKTALHWAAKQGHVEMADMMARCGADVNQRAMPKSISGTIMAREQLITGTATWIFFANTDRILVADGQEGGGANVTLSCQPFCLAHGVTATSVWRCAPVL